MICPARFFIAPNSVFNISVMPEPFNPANPRISPLSEREADVRRSTGASEMSADCRAACSTSCTEVDGCIDDRVGWSLTDHQVDELPLGDRVIDDEIGHLRAVSQDDDAIRDSDHLVQAVTDEDDGHPLRLERRHELEEMLDCVRVERRCHLVEDEDAGAEQHRFGDLHDLLLDQAEVRRRSDSDRSRIPSFDTMPSALGPHALEVEQPFLRALPVQEDVGGNGHVGHQRGLLMDEPDAELLGHGRTRDAYLVPRRWRRVPESGVQMPPMMLMSVDFPAPFRPTSETTSPALTAKSTLSQGVHAGKCLRDILRGSRKSARSERAFEIPWSLTV